MNHLRRSASTAPHADSGTAAKRDPNLAGVAVAVAAVPSAPVAAPTVVPAVVAVAIDARYLATGLLIVLTTVTGPTVVEVAVAAARSLAAAAGVAVEPKPADAAVVALWVVEEVRRWEVLAAVVSLRSW